MKIEQKLPLNTKVKYNKETCTIVGRCFNHRKKRWEYDLSGNNLYPYVPAEAFEVQRNVFPLNKNTA